MARGKARTEITLLDVLIDGRDLPMPSEAEARQKFDALAEEARRWKGPPVEERRDARRLIAWPDLEIRQVGRGIMVRVRAPWFSEWWHDAETWDGDPMTPIYDWLRQDRVDRQSATS